MAECKIGSQCYIDSKGIDLENKTVSVIMSDESKVLRFSYEDGMYDLILDHSEGAVVLTRKDIMPVLLQHETEDLPHGIWENVRLENRKLKGLARFDSEDPKAMEIFGKIARGFMQTFSVGINIIEKILESDIDGKKTYRATKWEITECSVVTVPAIPNARVGLAAMPDDAKIVNSHRGMPMELSQENFNALLAEKEVLSTQLKTLETQVETLELKNVEIEALKAEIDTKLSEAIASKTSYEQEVVTRVREAFSCNLTVETAVEMLGAETADKASLIALRAMSNGSGASPQSGSETKVNSWGDRFSKKS